MKSMQNTEQNTEQNTAESPILDVKPDHLAMVRQILHNNIPEYKVWAFGSRVKAQARNYSDLDLLIENDTALLPQIRRHIADDFGNSNLPWKVDFVEWARISDDFRQIIDRQKILIYAPDGNFG